ncbi:hypothetical protein LTR62_006215 [Meristemomyces frigidus]|uniref:AAA+ ATPase domain-containing protein n=1 Tax=Meristemomyces frigidus TaxID=1508187 RepID=A0AAN7TCE7_9PEZI|nr:hypothetical protein LTR62_006215 [Meristemomyces frigidus]
MRSLVRQSARLASQGRSSSANRVRQASIPRQTAAQQVRCFNNSVRRREDARPPHGNDENHWIEQRREEESRAAGPREAEEPGVEQRRDEERRSTVPGQAEDSSVPEEAPKVNSEARRTGRMSLRKLRERERKSGVAEVPKPPPIPAWFLKHNVFLVTDTPSGQKKEVLRCVDVETGHTLFSLPYYEPAEPRMTTIIRGMEVDVSCLGLQKDALSGLPDHGREETLIHNLQIQRAKKQHEIDVEGLAELLVALPNEMQEEILRREAVEGSSGKGKAGKTEESSVKDAKSSDRKRTSKPAAVSGMPDSFFNQKFGAQLSPSGSDDPRFEDSHPGRDSSEHCPPFSWVSLEAETAVRAALSMGGGAQQATSWASSRVDVSLHCPDGDSHDLMDGFVKDLGHTVGADVIRLDANDFEELAGEYVGSGQDAPGSLATLGYDVFNGYVASSVKDTPMFGNSNAEEDEFDMDEDEDEFDEDEDAEENRGGPPGFSNIEELRKALGDRRGQLGKMLSGVGIAHVHIGKPPSMMGGNPGAPPGFMFADAPKESMSFDDARLKALLDGLINAGRRKRIDAPQSTLAVEKRIQAFHPRMARALASHLETSAKATGSSHIKLEAGSEEPSASASPATSGEASRSTIIHVRELADLQNSGRSSAGPDIIRCLAQVVEKRRRSGESVVIVGTTAQSAQTSFFMPQSSHSREQSFRTISVPPLYLASVAESKTLEAAMSPLSTKTFADAGGYRRILEMNLRHLQSMLRRVRPGQEVDLVGKAAQAQMALQGTYSLGEKVLTQDQVQRLVLTAVGLAETHAKADTVQPVHIALATYVTSKSDQVAQTWSSSDRASKLSRPVDAGSKDKDGSGENKKSGQSKVEQIKGNCNQHEGRLLAGVVDAKNIKTEFGDVHAPSETIEALKTLTSLSLLRPEAFKYGVLANDRLPGLLLYGPPGTGKTLLAKAVAKESKATVLEVTGAQIYEKYVGEGEKMVRAVFSLAKKLSPCVVFIDEADAIFGSRGNAGNRNTHREIINQFLREWDGMDDRGVFVMVATNRPFDLDDAVLRRLPRRLLIDLPIAKDRESILRIHLTNEVLDPSVSLASLADRTPFYSGSDLKNLCVSAALACVREENALQLSDPQVNLPEKRVLEQKHFDQGVREISASISEDMGTLTSIRKFDEQFGDRRGRKKKSGYGFAPGGEVGRDERDVLVRPPPVVDSGSPATGTPP